MPRSKAIDILRALAILLVLGRHMEPKIPNGYSFMSFLGHEAIAMWQRGGWVGVDLFFVLSGFLVSGLLFREHQKLGELSGKSFLIRRGLKIYPAFWVLIAFTVAGALITRSNLHPRAMLAELLFLQNYWAFHWSHTWSLAVEEHFYLLLLAFLILLSRKGGANPFQCIPGVFVALAMICLGWRFVVSHRVPFLFETHMAPTHLRLDSLFGGVVIAYYYFYDRVRFLHLARRHRIVALMLGTLALAPAFLFPLETSPFLAAAGPIVFCLGSGLILIAALTVEPARNKVWTTIAYVGSHSYSVYLWHIPVALLLLPWVERLFGSYWHGSIYIVLYFAGSIAVGICMSLLVEFPILRLRDRWYPSRSEVEPMLPSPPLVVAV